jgi:hypothetical protein
MIRKFLEYYDENKGYVNITQYEYKKLCKNKYRIQNSQKKSIINFLKKHKMYINGSGGYYKIYINLHSKSRTISYFDLFKGDDDYFYVISNKYSDFEKNTNYHDYYQCDQLTGLFNLINDLKL